MCILKSIVMKGSTFWEIRKYSKNCRVHLYLYLSVFNYPMAQFRYRYNEEFKLILVHTLFYEKLIHYTLLEKISLICGLNLKNSLASCQITGPIYFKISLLCGVYWTLDQDYSLLKSKFYQILRAQKFIASMTMIDKTTNLWKFSNSKVQNQLNCQLTGQ